MYILLFLFWLLLNGKLTVEVVGLGLVIVALPVQVWEILNAGLVVGGDILFRRYRLTPTLVTFRADLNTDFGRFLLANSITLTPGTITVQVEGNQLTVHCLDKSMLDTSPDGTFQRWIRKMEDK